MSNVGSFPCMNIARRFSSDYGDVLIVWSFLLNFGIDFTKERPTVTLSIAGPDRTRIPASMALGGIPHHRVQEFQGAKHRIGRATVDAIERMVYQERQRRRQVQGTA